MSGLKKRRTSNLMRVFEDMSPVNKFSNLRLLMSSYGAHLDRFLINGLIRHHFITIYCAISKLIQRCCLNLDILETNREPFELFHLMRSKWLDRPDDVLLHHMRY